MEPGFGSLCLLEGSYKEPTTLVEVGKLSPECWLGMLPNLPPLLLSPMRLLLQ